MYTLAAPLTILDGGLATELEALGHDLRHPLWSARMLMENPGAIMAVHRAYLEAGAQAITTASYQATLPALMHMGLDKQKAAAVIAFSVEIAVQAVDDFMQTAPTTAPRPKVIGSLGPYGAFLADGSEFRGHYGLAVQDLYDHHFLQMEVMALCPVDYIAYETVPSALEALALSKLFQNFPDKQGWISFSCRDGLHLNDGTPISDMVELVDQTENILGLGINCTAPQHIAPLLRAARAQGLKKPAIVYPNSGEQFDSGTMAWTGQAALEDFGRMALEWRDLGATMIGGCCRTKPSHIKLLRETFR